MTVLDERRSPHARLLAVTGGFPVLPLVLLFSFALVDQLDRAAFAVLAPDIERSFHLSDKEFLSLVTASSAVVILGALPTGRLADRMDRIVLCRVVAMLWAVGSILIGVSPILAILVVGRLLGGLGRIAVEPLHSSLLADYYPEERRPRVYATHRLATFVGSLIGPLLAVAIAHLAGGHDGWRWSFAVLAIPTVYLVHRARVLRDPGRHDSVVPVAALAPDSPVEAQLGVRPALRELARLGTLRRLWLAAAFFGAGVGSLPVFISTFSDHALHIGDSGRSYLSVGFAVAGFLGLLVAGQLAQKAVDRGDTAALATQTGGAIVLAGLATVAAAPCPLVVSVVFLLISGLFIESFFPAYLALIAAVTPARLRAQAYGSTLTAVGLGAVFVGIPVGTVSSSAGPRSGFALLGIAITVGGLCAASAHGAVVKDLA